MDRGNICNLVERILWFYTGELLPEFLYEDWTSTQREACLDRWRAITIHVANRLARDRQWDGAIERLMALVEVDPTHEEGARLLIHALVQTERRDEARQVYGRLAAVLDDELGIPPDDLTAALASGLQRATALPVEISPRERAERLLREIRSTSGERAAPGMARRHARLWGERALALETMGESELALISIESGEFTIGDLDLPGERSRLLIAQATVRWHQGHAELARRAAQQAERLARDAGERGIQAWAIRLQAQAAQQLGHLEDAIDLARRSAALYEALGAPEHALRSRRIVALCVWHAGRFVEAEILFRENLVEALRLNHLEHRAYTLCGLGSALLAQGALDQAEVHLEEAVSLAVELSDYFLELSAQYHLANLWAQRWYVVSQGSGGDAERAEAEATNRFRRVMSMAKAQNSDSMHAFSCIDFALASLEWGRVEQAQALASVARSMAEGVADNIPVQGWCALCEAETALVYGDVEAAQRGVTAAIPLLLSASPAGIAHAHRVAARCHADDPRQFRMHTSLSLAAAIQRNQTLEELRTQRIIGSA
jgi:tetratricopeptide (TPR) repeat protein